MMSGLILRLCLRVQFLNKKKQIPIIMTITVSCVLVLIFYWKHKYMTSWIKYADSRMHNVTSDLENSQTFEADETLTVDQNLNQIVTNIRLYRSESQKHIDLFKKNDDEMKIDAGLRNFKAHVKEKSAHKETNGIQTDVRPTNKDLINKDLINKDLINKDLINKDLINKDLINKTVLCPEDPPALIGLTSANTTQITKTELMKLFPDIKDGHLIPSNCTPRQKLALLFPYRNRFDHLHVLLHNLIPFLIRQQADVRLFVIEQADQSTFNKGVLLNAGFSEADKVGSFDCYIVHDVDLIPLNDNNLYRCSDRPRHFTVAINKFNYKLFYESHFGGVVAYSRDQFLELNGYSNLYFGWGSEDDDMYNRVCNKGYSIVRYNETIARYDMIKHDRDIGNQENPLRHNLMKSSSMRQDVDGVNTVKYKVLDMQTEQLYTWIKVTFNINHLIQAAPPYVQEMLVQAQKSSIL